uniref:Aminotransferase-like plant mobile domain-containing protein n=2 Tax=Oryza sativa subsp. japonica TaxID=39947 RepID=Q53MZ9_ORYSJ|nr:hypothetical protein LOC_Os11g14590 [Oryza sativa Japonica Group]ABA92432.1 hypothetical protein LOC_Os11g14590 [Oryza sativa Japonica Group]
MARQRRRQDCAARGEMAWGSVWLGTGLGAKNFVTYSSRRGGGASNTELVRGDLEGEGDKKRPLLGNDLGEAGPSKRHCGSDDVNAAREMKRELVQEGLDLSEHLSESVHWSLYGGNPEYPMEVEGQYVNPDDYFDVELSGGHDSVSVEVNREEVDEEANSDDDRPFPPLTNNDKLALEECRAFQKVFGRKPDIPKFRDLTHAHGAILDGGITLDQLPEPFQLWMWLRLPVGRPKWRQSFTPWPYNEPDMEKTVAYLFESTATAHAHRDVAYKHYVNEMDCLQPQHIEWLPYHTNEASSLTLNSICNRDSDYFMYQCPLICFWAVEYHLPHHVMRQFGKKQDWPVEDISTGVELHKYDRVKTKKVKDWGLENNRYIDEWRTAGRNDRTYRLFLRPTWTEADIEDDRDSDEGRNPYDVRTRVGYQMEHAPLRDRVSRELLRSVNEMGHALQAPRGGEDTENTLCNVLEKVRQRCRKLAARLGCRSVGLDDVYQPRRLLPPLPQSARPSTARHSIRIEEREEVGGSSSSHIPQGRGKGKAPAPPSDDDDDDNEEDEDYIAPDAEEIDMSQLPDAPQGTQPTQYNLRSTRAAKKSEAEGGANHPGAAVGEGGASHCREAEGFRCGGRAAPATLAPWSMRAAPAEARRQKGFGGGGGRRQPPWRRGP